MLLRTARSRRVAVVSHRTTTTQLLQPPETKASAGGTGKLDVLTAATAASGAEPASAGAQGDGDANPAPPSRVDVRPDLVSKPGHKNRENQENASGV